MESKKVVYSTDQGRHCRSCGQPVKECNCGQPAIKLYDNIVRLQRQKKGRNGKTITFVSGLAHSGTELKNLAKELKSKCGVGGSIEGHDIVIQGDKRIPLKELLESKGYRVKMSGG